MITIRPFKGLRPRKDIADKVAAKPYDVLNSQEAKEEAKDNPFSFLKISKPEINFDTTIDQYADEVYENLEIGNGGEAMDTFLRLVKGDAEILEKKEEVMTNLLAYCKMDTWAMVRILEELLIK